jgi:DNA polymerase-3 subunit beta
MEEIDITYNGDDVDVGFNVNYLIDAIAVINNDNILFEVGLGLKPSVVKPAESDNFLCIVMPLKI